MNKRTRNRKKPRKGNGKDTLAVNVKITDGHIEAAAKAMQAMKDFSGGPIEAQISIAIMSVWLCMQGKIPGDEFVQGIFRNMNAIAGNQQLIIQINNAIIKQIQEVKIVIPGRDF